MNRYVKGVLSLVIALALITACANTTPSGGGAGSAGVGNSTVQKAEEDAAAKFPERDITLILGFAAGAGADLTSRAIMPFVEETLSKKVIIDYNPGSGGELSFAQLALNTAADGYNWTWICTPHLVIYPISRDTCEYTLDQVQAVCQISYDPCIFAVPESSPFQTLTDLVQYAQAHPGEVTIGNGGTGGDDFIANLKFIQAADVALNQVAYANGAGEEITALLGGHIDVATFNASESAQYEGLRLLGVMSEERVGIIPDIPTFAEQGYDIVMSSDRGFAVPAGTDMGIVHKIADAVEKAVGNPEFQKKAESLSLLLEYKNPEEFTSYMNDYTASMQALYDANPW